LIQPGRLSVKLFTFAVSGVIFVIVAICHCSVLT